MMYLEKHNNPDDDRFLSLTSYRIETARYFLRKWREAHSAGIGQKLEDQYHWGRETGHNYFAMVTAARSCYHVLEDEARDSPLRDEIFAFLETAVPNWEEVKYLRDMVQKQGSVDVLTFEFEDDKFSFEVGTQRESLTISFTAKEPIPIPDGKTSREVMLEHLIETAPRFAKGMEAVKAKSIHLAREGAIYSNYQEVYDLVRSFIDGVENTVMFAKGLAEERTNKA